MLDLLRAVAVIVAVVSAVKQRFVLGIVCALGCAYALVASLVGVAGALRHRVVGAEWASALFFLGPSAVPEAHDSAMPAATWIATHTLAALSCSTALCVIPLAWSWRRSAALSPHSLESRRWDAISSAFLLLAVIALIRLVAGGLLEWILVRQERL